MRSRTHTDFEEFDFAGDAPAPPPERKQFVKPSPRVPPREARVKDIDVVEETKEEELPSSVSPSAPPGYTKGLRRLQLADKYHMNMPRGRGSSGSTATYNVRFVFAGAITTNGSGVVANVFAADPSTLPFSDWTAFAALFDEVKVTSFELRLVPYSDTATQMITSIATGAFLNKGSTPSTILNVLDSDNGTIVSPLMVKPHICKLKVPKLSYAPTTTPAGTSAYGCPGYVHLYCTAKVSTSILTYQLVAHYSLRGRM